MNEKHFCLLRLSRIDNALPLYFSASFSPPQCFWNIGEIGAKKNFTEQSKANTFQLFITIEGYFSGLFFF